MRRASNFTQGKILSPLLAFALPVLLALVLQAMYGAVDLYIVGRFASPADVSAVSTGSQIMQTVTSVIVGLSMGTTILLGQKIGQGRSEEAGAVVGSGVALFAVIALAVTAAALAFAPALSSVMHAPAEAFSQTVDYVRICSAGTVFIVAYNVMGSIFRGIGDSKTPLVTVSMACCVNIAGDLILVKGFGMGAAGAAWATVLAQGVSVAASLLIIRFRGAPFAITRKHLRFQEPYIFHMVRLGLPIALQDGPIIAAAFDYLRAYSIDCLLTSFLFCFIGYFNGCGKTTFVMIQGIAGAFLVRVPVSYFMSRLVPVSLFYVGLATPASSVVQIALCGVYFLFLRRRADRPLGG